MERSKSFTIKNGISLNDLSWIGSTGVDLSDTYTDEGDVVVRTVNDVNGSYSVLFLKKYNSYVKINDAKHNLNANSAPSVNNDNTQGYSISSLWIDTVNDKSYICVDNTTGSAVWIEMGGSGGSGSYPYSITQSPSGFSDTSNITVTYDSVNRTVTLNGSFVCLHKGIPVPILVNGYVSPAHSNTTGIPHYLYYSDSSSSVVWSNTIWGSADIPIASVYRGNFNVCIKECQGLMDFRSRYAFVKGLGGVVDNGLTISEGSFVKNSTVSTERRPYINSGLLLNEDIFTYINAVGSGNYTLCRLDSSGDVIETINQTEIVSLSGNQPYYNSCSGGVWGQSLMGVNTFSKGFIIAVPVSNDSFSQSRRIIWLMPQNNSSDELYVKSILPKDVKLGSLSIFSRKIVFIGEYIIQYVSGNWVIREVNSLINKINKQIDIPIVVKRALYHSYFKKFSSNTQLVNWSDSSPQMTDFYNYSTWVNGGFQTELSSIRGAVMLPFDVTGVSYVCRVRLCRIGTGSIPSNTAVTGNLHLVRTNATNASSVAAIPIVFYTTENLSQGQAQQPNNPSISKGSYVVSGLNTGDYIGVSLVLDSTDWGVTGDVSISLELREL